MCFPEGVNSIAIFGPACTGKSTVADEMGKILDCQVRHCGEIIKAKARASGITPRDLSDQDHHKIDLETVKFTEMRELRRIVEGGFLDLVLRNVTNAIFIRLKCDETERRNRYQAKGVVIPSTLEERDNQDAALKSRLYPGILPITDRIIEITTTDKSPQDTAVEIVDAIKNSINMA